MSRYKQLGKNTALVFIGNIGSKLIALLMLPFYTKWLSVEDYGTSDNVLVYVGLLLAIVTLSISESIFIFPKNQEVEEQKQYFSSGLLYTTLFLVFTGILLYAIREVLSATKILNSIASNMGYIYLLIIAFFCQTFFQQFSRSINKVRVYAVSGVVLTFFTASLSFLLIPIYGLDGFFVAQITSLFIAAIYSIVHSGAYRYVSFRFVKVDKYREMIKYSIPLIPNAIMWWLVGSLNRPIMEEYLGMHSIGLFAVAYKFPSLINVLFSVFMVSWQISVIEEYQKEGYEKFYNKILKLVFTVLSFCVIILSVVGKTLIDFIADAKFYDSWKYIPILALSALFSSISGFVGCNFSATRESKFYFYSSVWGAVIAILFNIVLIPIWGLYGAVTAIVLSHLTMVLLRVKYSWKIVKITNIYFYFFVLIICFVMVLILSFIEDAFIVVSSTLIGLVLFSLLIKNDMLDGINLLKLVIKKKRSK
jgi:O-antigen/teichoic acid export membrane protein